MEKKIKNKPTKEIKGIKKVEVKKTNNKKEIVVKNDEKIKSKGKNNTSMLAIVIIVIAVLCVTLLLYFCIFYKKDNNINKPSNAVSNNISTDNVVDNRKIITVKGDASLKVYDNNKKILKSVTTDTGNSVESYASFYTDNTEKRIEANIKENVEKITITGVGNISIWIYLTNGQEGPIVGYELNNINIDGKEINVDTDFNINQTPIFKQINSNGETEILTPIVVK